MHIADLQPRLVQIFGEILGHPLGQRCDQSAIALGRRRLRFDDQILDLLLDRLDLDRRVDQAGRADHLLGEDAFGLLQLPAARRRRHRHRLRPHRVPFVEAQRPVVDAARQPEAIFRQRDLPAMVAPRHRADLRHRLVALVEKQQGVVGEIFEQCRRRLARQPTGQEAAVILDPRAAAGRRDHLQVEIGALLQPLVLQQFPFRLQLLQPLLQFEADRLHRLLHRRPGRDIVRIGEDADMLQACRLLAGQRVELDDLLDLVAEEGDPPGAVLIV